VPGKRNQGIGLNGSVKQRIVAVIIAVFDFGLGAYLRGELRMGGFTRVNASPKAPFLFFFHFIQLTPQKLSAGR